MNVDTPPLVGNCGETSGCTWVNVLANFGARYDDSSFGRFMSPDWSEGAVPVPYADLSNPQSLNLYSYVNNNPMTRVDKDGHCWSGFQSFCNFVNWGHWVDNDHLNEALQQEADQARADLAKTQNLNFNGQAPADFASGLNNQQAILAKRALVEFLANTALRGLQNPCPEGAACGVVFPVDFSTGETLNWSATFETEGEARALARTKLGSDPVEVEPGKWRSRNGKWQYRAKPGDVSDDHVHLEQLNPNTGEVIQNLHLRWPGEAGRP
jgi:RHS repeat-associated protein